MENIEKILLQIVDRLEKIESKQDQLQADITGIRSNQERMEKKLDVVTDQVAGLTEFKEATTIRLENMDAKLDQVVKNVEFLKYKEYQNEQDIFYLKKRL